MHIFCSLTFSTNVFSGGPRATSSQAPRIAAVRPHRSETSSPPAAAVFSQPHSRAHPQDQFQPIEEILTNPQSIKDDNKTVTYGGDTLHQSVEQTTFSSCDGDSMENTPDNGDVPSNTKSKDPGTDPDGSISRKESETSAPGIDLFNRDSSSHSRRYTKKQMNV